MGTKKWSPLMNTGWDAFVFYSFMARANLNFNFNRARERQQWIFASMLTCIYITLLIFVESAVTYVNDL